MLILKSYKCMYQTARWHIECACSHVTCGVNCLVPALFPIQRRLALLKAWIWRWIRQNDRSQQLSNIAALLHHSLPAVTFSERRRRTFLSHSVICWIHFEHVWIEKNVVLFWCCFQIVAYLNQNWFRSRRSHSRCKLCSERLWPPNVAGSAGLHSLQFFSCPFNKEHQEVPVSMVFVSLDRQQDSMDLIPSRRHW